MQLVVEGPPAKVIIKHHPVICAKLAMSNVENFPVDDFMSK